MILFLYNILFPLVFLFFIPGIIIKLIRRPGYKATFLERFSIFSSDKKRKLRESSGCIWIHSVSVGETMIAMALIRKWQEMNPERKFVLSTTTTTGQALARSKAPEGVEVIFCPVDFIIFVNRTFKLLNPCMLVIFETEIWPNMLNIARKRCGRVALVNARMSDKSVRGYVKFSSFFKPILESFNFISVQTEEDRVRFNTVAPSVDVRVSGNMKFDQKVPENMPDIELCEYFGEGGHKIILAASTHPGEEKLIAETYMQIKKDFPEWKLVIIPRHAERGTDIVNILKSLNISLHRRTSSQPASGNCDCLLADTTGEMLGFIKKADVVIMGKSLAGQNEGHNLIEPALLGKPIICGSVLKNFRFVLNVLKEKDALVTVDSDSALEPALLRLIKDEPYREELGKRAKDAIISHEGATVKTIKMLEDSL